jgi:hypothetical protein
VNTEVGSPDSGEKARVPVRVAVKTHREERERERERVWLRGVLVFELWILRERERENWRFY